MGQHILHLQAARIDFSIILYPAYEAGKGAFSNSFIYLVFSAVCLL